MLLSAGTGDNKIHLIDVDKQQLISTYEGHQAQICSIFAWNSQNFVSASQDGTVRLWDIRQMTPVQTIGPRASSIEIFQIEKNRALFFDEKFSILFRSWRFGSVGRKFWPSVDCWLSRF